MSFTLMSLDSRVTRSLWVAKVHFFLSTSSDFCLDLKLDVTTKLKYLIMNTVVAF